MTSLIGSFFKQSAEVLDYPVDFSPWFVGRNDDPASIAVTAEAGVTVVSSSLEGKVVRVVIGGGTNGQKYKITVRLTTTDGIVREVDFQVRIKDV